MTRPYTFDASPSSVALVVLHNVHIPDAFFGFVTVNGARKCAKDLGSFGFWRVKGAKA